jgi:hypothetical protein
MAYFEKIRLYRMEKEYKGKRVPSLVPKGKFGLFFFLKRRAIFERKNPCPLIEKFHKILLFFERRISL